MGIIIWLIVGGIVGWLASLVMRTDAQQGVLLNVVVGIVGAVLGGLGAALASAALWLGVTPGVTAALVLAACSRVRAMRWSTSTCVTSSLLTTATM